jgi:hypothetical protein
MIAAEIVFTVLTSLWCALAWRYAEPPPSHARRVWAVIGFVTPLALLLSSPQAGALAAIVILAVTLAWYLRLKPSNAHAWETEYARASVARRDGNLMHITDVRNFRYHSITRSGLLRRHL